MADVLIVCVREDEPQAKALAEMFEAAGFSIGGAPSSDGALRSSGAGVVVWSQASIRSRPFLDAAQRVINADKAVVASLIEPPPPSSVGNSPSFDLSDWNGDPNDPSLDPLFFAVDRMVNSQRASAGAPVAEEPPAYEPPPPRASPPPRAPARAAPPPSNDPLSSESEHWRAIRDSRNPADFMDYLARYGPDGAFSEVAELRLKQLTGASERGQPRPRIDTPPQRREPPSVRREPVVRAPPPPPRRMEAAAPPPRRLDLPPRQQPNFDRPPPRSHNARPDLRDPPKAEGGALRAILLVALLGGVALAGGLYFGGGGMPDFGARTQTAPQTQEPASAASVEPPSAEESGTPLSEAAAPGRASVVQPAPRRELPPPQRTASVEPRRDLNAAAAIPNRVQSNTSGGGPISLVGPQSNAPSPSQTQSPFVPLGPQTDAPPAVLAANVPPPVVEPAPPGAVRWAARPTARRIADLYPDSAARLGVGGRVDLDCVVTQTLSLSCRIASESPPALGFGRAALSAANTYRAQPALSNGSGAVGARTRIAVQFQAPSP